MIGPWSTWAAAWGNWPCRPSSATPTCPVSSPSSLRPRAPKRVCSIVYPVFSLFFLSITQHTHTHIHINIKAYKPYSASAT